MLGQKYWGSTFKLGNKYWGSTFSRGVLLGCYTGADPRSAPVLPSVYTGLFLGRAFASRMFCRSCHAPFRILLYHSKLK